MQLKNRIIGFLLIAIYMVVIIQQSTHSCLPDKCIDDSNSHHHGDFEEVHHEHRFHVGIFHFLGHLLESFTQADIHSQDHLAIIQNTSNKKYVDCNNPVNPYTQLQHLLVVEMDPESIPDPPYHIPFLQKLNKANTLLRAPPAIV